MLTPEEVADFLRVNVKTVYAAINEKQLPGRKVRGVTRIYRDALLDWLRSTERVRPQRTGRKR